jgi:hypothetical protein
MEYLINEKDTLENAIKYLDALSKSLDGLKDKYSTLIFDAQMKHEKIEPVLKNWVLDVNLLMISKFQDIYSIKNNCDENYVLTHMKNWCNKFKENNDFSMNIKALFKNIQNVRTTVKNKLSAIDVMSNTSLTENLINKNKNQK